MARSRADEFISKLKAGNDPNRKVTVKISGEALAALDEYDAYGSYGERANAMILIAHEYLQQLRGTE